MKEANIQDHWRRLGKRLPQCVLTSLSGEAVPNLPNDPVSLRGAITVITGLNGVGKSTLLHAAWLLLRRDENPAIELSVLQGCKGVLAGALYEGEKEIALRSELADGQVSSEPSIVEPSVTWIDPAFEIPTLIKTLRLQKNLGEALQQVEPYEAKMQEVSTLSWLVGKEYDRCEVYELELVENGPVTPYFRVSVGGRDYGSEGMGLGEASLHFIFWHLKRMPANGVVLIEEPETYISSRSQAAVMNHLAEVCHKRNCSAIVTTHSPQIFERVPPQHTLIVTPEQRC